jgi:DNA-binding transcriptional LysR family regulator
MRELGALWYFVQVADAGSFTAAAERLSISTAALSRSVARLEKRMHVQLLVRTSRALRLTDEGRALLEEAGPALRTVEDSLGRVRAMSGSPAGLVRLSTVTAYGKHCVLPLLPEFFERYREIDLVMSFHDGGRGLSREAYDIRINWGEEREQRKVAQTLCRMPLILVASPEYLRRRGTPRTPEDLAQHDCINVILTGARAGQWVFEPAYGKRREQRRKVVRPQGRLLVADELDAVAEAAENGLGLTVSSAENVLPALTDGRLVRLMQDYTVLGQSMLETEVIMQYASRRGLPPKVRTVVDFLLERLQHRDPLEIATAVLRRRS